MITNKIRLQEIESTAYTRTVSNQVGPDIAATKRTGLPTFTDSNSIYVAKSGNDSNAGTFASPKLTVQAAVNAAVINNRANVCIKDSGIYQEKVNAKTKSIYAYPTCSPTIKYPDTDPETYTVDEYEICAQDYYGGQGETSLKGAAGTYFTGTIYDSLTHNGVYWLASDNGIWYSRCGFSGWLLVPGTAAQTYSHLVLSRGKMWARKAGAGLVSVAASGVTLEYALTDISGVMGNDSFLMCVYKSTDNKIKAVFQSNTYGYDEYTYSPAFNTPTCAAVYKTVGYNNGAYRVPIADGFRLYFFNVKLFSDTAFTFGPIMAGIFGSNWPIANYMTNAAYWDSVTTTYYISNNLGLYAIRYKSDGSVTEAGFISTISGTVTRIEKIDNKIYLSKANGLSYTTDFLTETSLLTSVPAISHIIDTDIGRLVFGQNFGDDCYPSLWLWKKNVVSNMQRVDGITIDGNNLAKTGVYASYANGEHETTKWCTIKNCTLAGFRDGGIAGQRSYIQNTILQNNEIAIKAADFANTFTRVHNCYIHSNRYGLYSVGYDQMIGPEIAYCVIADNTYTGIWYQYLGAALNPYVSAVWYSIVYGNGLDICIKNQVPCGGSIQWTVYGTLDIDSHITVSSTTTSQANPLLLSNGDYQDKAGGYPFDSVAKTVGAGMFAITRTQSTVNGVDYAFKYLPEKLSVSYQANNFTSNINGLGDYSETWDGCKRLFNLSFSEDQFSDCLEYHKFVNLYKQENKTLRYGYTTNGTDWVNLLGTVPTVVECDDGDSLETKSNHPIVGVNEYAGYYLSVRDNVSGNDIYFRIISHNESNGTVPVVFYIDRSTYPGYCFFSENEPLTVDFLPVKIDKSSAFAASKYGYLTDPLRGYNLTLREVSI